MCSRCGGKGFTESVKQEKRTKCNVITVCSCDRGVELEKLWEKYPAWLGAPYEFFFL